MVCDNTSAYVWQSSVLRTSDSYADFLTAFVNGDRSPVVMLEVIKLLDSVLAIWEVVLRALTESAIESKNAVDEVTEQIELATKGSIPKPTAEEILESVRKIFDQFSWEYGSDDYVYAEIEYKLWDELRSLLQR